MLKVLGKFTCGSGIDSVFLEAGIYGPTTLGQIIEGKHYKRGMEAHMTMYLAIKKLLYQEILGETDDWNQFVNCFHGIVEPLDVFGRYQHEGDKLPPTFEALKYKTFRSHYVTMVLRRAHLSKQNLPSPLDFGWECTEKNKITPIMTGNLPAPLALIEMVSCS